MTDLSKPSFGAAYALARKLAQAGDRPGAQALFSRLLWHVPKEEGGFIGLTESQLRDACDADKRLDYQAALDAMWAPGPWPVEAAKDAAA